MTLLETTPLAMTTIAITFEINDTIDDDVDIDVYPLVVTAQLDYALDTIRDAVDNNGVETGTKKHMIQTPNGKSLSNGRG